MFKTGYFLILLSLVTIGVIGAISKSLVYVQNNVLGNGTQLSESQILSLINLERAKNSLKPLTLNNSLSQAAQNKAGDLANSSEWSHVVQGKTPWSYLDTVGYTYSYAGENLARNFTTNEAVVQAWLNSPSHKANILNSQYSETGLAIAQTNNNNQVVIVQLFGHPLDPSLSLSPSYQLTQEIQQDLKIAKPYVISIGMVALTLGFVSIIIVLTTSFVQTHKHFVPSRDLWRLNKSS